jgi:charged multivesicular body protein 6
MLGGQITNQEEDEVEDELDALEAEMTGVPLPDVPKAELSSRIKDRAKARLREREEQEESRVAMLA